MQIGLAAKQMEMMAVDVYKIDGKKRILTNHWMLIFFCISWETRCFLFPVLTEFNYFFSLSYELFLIKFVYPLLYTYTCINLLYLPASTQYFEYFLYWMHHIPWWTYCLLLEHNSWHKVLVGRLFLAALTSKHGFHLGNSVELDVAQGKED